MPGNIGAVEQPEEPTRTGAEHLVQEAQAEAEQLVLSARDQPCR